MVEIEFFLCFPMVGAYLLVDNGCGLWVMVCMDEGVTTELE
jgi:hypothetical protein